MEYLAVGDLHLDAMSRYYVKNLGLSYQIKTLLTALDYAKQHRIKNVVLLGDIADTPELSYEAQSALYSVFIKYSDIHFIILLGNHDIGRGSNSLSVLTSISNLFSNITVVDKSTKLEHGVYAHGWPNHSSKKGNLNFCHVDQNGAIADNGYSVTESRFDLADTQKYVSGHLHTYQKSKNAIWPGTLYQVKFGESQKKYFLHLSIGSAISFKAIPVESPIQLIDHYYNGSLPDTLDTAKIKVYCKYGEVIDDDSRIYKTIIVKDKDDIDKIQNATLDLGSGFSSFDHRTVLQKLMGEQNKSLRFITRAKKYVREYESILSNKT
jgi:DNA repair exonuclease SbcCD nuclease subunit